MDRMVPEAVTTVIHTAGVHMMITVRSAGLETLADMVRSEDLVMGTRSVTPGHMAGEDSRAAASRKEEIHLRAAANYIRSGHYREALNVLDGIKDRSALWYFYSASANSGLGNNVTALEQAKEAVRLEPDNTQYQMLLQRLQNGESWYEQRQSTYGYPGSFDTSSLRKTLYSESAVQPLLRRQRIVLRRIRRRVLYVK